MLSNIHGIWGLISGLLIGAGVFGHALRLVILEPTWGGRHNVAAFAIVLYSVSGILTLFRNKLGLYIAIIGPLGGITAVTALGKHIDLFQFVLGIPQFMAIFLSIWLLILLRKENETKV